MANNCLVTKLKGSVQSELDYLGALSIIVESDPNADIDSRKVTIVPFNGETIRVWSNKQDAFSIDGGTTYISSTELVQRTSLIFADGNYKVYVSNKYHINEISYANSIKPKTYGFDVESLGVKSLYVNNMKLFGAWNKAFTNITETFVASEGSYNSDNKATLDLDKENNFGESLKTFQMRIGLKGNIEHLAKCPNLSSLTFAGREVYGDVANLIQAIGATGRDWGSLTINCYNTSCTYNGEEITNAITVSFPLS